uniref:Uncharacterized protein n=1 Tax=Cacopsylla melanoneura TaxID=428564 RepID=A0A8D9AGT2_9HEMI
MYYAVGVGTVTYLGIYVLSIPTYFFAIFLSSRHCAQFSNCPGFSMLTRMTLNPVLLIGTYAVLLNFLSRAMQQSSGSQNNSEFLLPTVNSYYCDQTEQLEALNVSSYLRNVIACVESTTLGI